MSLGINQYVTGIPWDRENTICPVCLKPIETPRHSVRIQWNFMHDPEEPSNSFVLYVHIGCMPDLDTKHCHKVAEEQHAKRRT